MRSDFATLGLHNAGRDAARQYADRPHSRVTRGRGLSFFYYQNGSETGMPERASVIKRTATVSLRLRPGEKDEIIRAAAAVQKTVPEFAREVVLSAARRAQRSTQPRVAPQPLDENAS